MARRVSLPKADDIFRATATEPVPAQVIEQPAPVSAVKPKRVAKKAAPSAAADVAETTSTKKPSGRVKHDAKMTVYVSDDELVELEHARLQLRRNHGIAVDRGRLVREAMALVLAEFETKGAKSSLVKRLTED